MYILFFIIEKYLIKILNYILFNFVLYDKQCKNKLVKAEKGKWSYKKNISMNMVDLEYQIAFSIWKSVLGHFFPTESHIISKLRITQQVQMERFYHKSIFYHSPKQRRHRKMQSPAAPAPWVVWQSGGRNCPNIHRHSLRNCWWSSQTSARRWFVYVWVGWKRRWSLSLHARAGCCLQKKTCFRFLSKETAIQLCDKGWDS